jgi:SAM-dependent methyltransferase
MISENEPNPSVSSQDFEFQALSEAKNYRRALVDEFAPALQGAVVEVGAGIGQMSAELLSIPSIGSLTCIEPDERFVARFAQNRFDVELIRGTIDDFKAPADAIVSVNVLEHIEEDERELRKYCSVLSERGGKLCLFVPARQELYAPIDADFGHFRRYSIHHLRGLLGKTGFRIQLIHYYNLPGYLIWYVNFRLLKKRAFELNSVRLFDRLVFPVVHFVESRICRPCIGQSLIAIASPE